LFDKSESPDLAKYVITVNIDGTIGLWDRSDSNLMTLAPESFGDKAHDVLERYNISSTMFEPVKVDEDELKRAMDMMSNESRPEKRNRNAPLYGLANHLSMGRIRWKDYRWLEPDFKMSEIEPKDTS